MPFAVLRKMHSDITKETFLNLLKIEFVIGDIPLGFAKQQGDDKVNQSKGDHHFEIILAFDHPIMCPHSLFSVLCNMASPSDPRSQRRVPPGTALSRLPLYFPAR